MNNRLARQQVVDKAGRKTELVSLLTAFKAKCGNISARQVCARTDADAICRGE